MESAVTGEQPVLARVLHRMLVQVNQLLDYLGLTRVASPKRSRHPVALGVSPVVIKACVPLASTLGGGRVDLLEVGDDLADRAKEAVEIQAVEAGLHASLVRQAILS